MLIQNSFDFSKGRKQGSSAAQCAHVQDDMEELPYPTVKEYMIWVRNRMTVTFRRLEHPKVTPTWVICCLLTPL